MRPLLQRRLDQVSRSFALCIPQLDTPFQDRVALAYLLFRVLDTVEDAPFTDRELQQSQFAAMRSFLRTTPAPAELARFIESFPPQISESERALVGDTGTLFADAYALPSGVRKAMFYAMDRMAIGMAAYARRPVPLQLVDLEDVTRYCCFVAGLVGEMLTELWAFDSSAPAPRFALAYHFGLFLQKVNILKDQDEDEAAGRFLVPDHTALCASLRADALGALSYIQSLPTAERGYRTFCAWALMMGLVTIAQLDQPRYSRRAQTQDLLARTAEIACDNAALGYQFVELMPQLPAIVPQQPREKPESSLWFRNMLLAPLSDAELAAIGIVT